MCPPATNAKMFAKRRLKMVKAAVGINKMQGFGLVEEVSQSPRSLSRI
jgi:hypothetical protein